MSRQLIGRSPDLQRLRDEGYDIEIQSGYLVMRDVPYVTARQEVRRGTLVSELTLAGDVTSVPSTHVVHFIGEHPCHKDGSELAQIKHQSMTQPLAPDLTVNHSFSNKPAGNYPDYYAKMTTYANILSGPAEALDPFVTARTFPVIVAEPEETVFQYLDTASSRAGITTVANKLAGGTIGIIGLGGTGSYVLDLVAKTPVREIHLFDHDTFAQHNAFRSPGAPSIDDLRQRRNKAVYFQERYSSMHRHVIAHPYAIDDSNVEELRTLTFVFLCVDSGSARRLLIERLEQFDTSFIDVGMGLQQDGSNLGGILRVTTSTPTQRNHVHANHRIPFGDDAGDDAYAQNIQIADLNALNAAMAVLKWKKLVGFYRDLEREHHTTYTIDGNLLTSEDCL